MKDAQLTPQMLAFLDALAPHDKPVTRTALGCVASKEEERARAARRLPPARIRQVSPPDGNRAARMVDYRGRAESLRRPNPYGRRVKWQSL